jgi:hypothetical protein
MSRQREILENELALMGDGDPPDDCAWVCRCRKQDGTIETTYWMTEDGACEAEAELERLYPGTVCVVFSRS